MPLLRKRREFAMPLLRKRPVLQWVEETDVHSRHSQCPALQGRRYAAHLLLISGRSLHQILDTHFCASTNVCLISGE